MRVLVAPDKFKGTLSAVEVAEVIAGELRAHGFEADPCPLADGGDGTLEVFWSQGFERREVETVDAHGRPHRAAIGWRDGVAVLEMARICGLQTVLDLPMDGWTASSAGLGIAARNAIAMGARHIILCIGGSASVDGGIGLLAELGIVGIDASGTPVTPDARGLLQVDALVGDAPMGVTWRVLTDVDVPLLGAAGTTAFAQQKGFAPADLPALDAALERWSAILAPRAGHDVRALAGAGAAGGVGAGVLGALAASRVSGSRAVAEMVGLDDRLRRCDVVVTGEGRLDETSLHGKVVGLVRELAMTFDRHVHVICGSVAPAIDLSAFGGVWPTQGSGEALPATAAVARARVASAASALAASLR